MHHLEFTGVYEYSRDEENIVVPIVLRVGSNHLPVAASLDTGASFCLFGTEIAEALGLDISSGIRKRFRTANSAFDAFGHEVEIAAFGIATQTIVYFVADPMIDKNVLGRIGSLDRVSLASFTTTTGSIWRPMANPEGSPSQPFGLEQTDSARSTWTRIPSAQMDAGHSGQCARNSVSRCSTSPRNFVESIPPKTRITVLQPNNR